ncbi:hypothetical protein BS47DRAFT_729522 [Hydnum rufescens UP504]|uniref:Uncharacterized protein n=1 Tax=Hydnum rufescens UP504 TaxID=1448309 RepID=A0A9P6DZF3_9AGAM|nr:hypothetical protein BS47DRAFT_729522 [Hydnum rufescens UP504]
MEAGHEQTAHEDARRKKNCERKRRSWTLLGGAHRNFIAIYVTMTAVVRCTVQIYESGTPRSYVGLCVRIDQKVSLFSRGGAVGHFHLQKIGRNTLKVKLRPWGRITGLWSAPGCPIQRKLRLV